MIKIYRDDNAQSIFLEDANGAQFPNSLQAVLSHDDDTRISIVDLARSYEIVSNELFSDFVNENEVQYGVDGVTTVNALNAEFTASGTPSSELPVITSPTVINAVSGEIINYNLTADFGVGYEWSGLPDGLVVKNGNLRGLIGSLNAGTYTPTMTAVNYNGTDSQTLTINVSNPPFANTKSVQFNNNDWLGANAGILSSTLGRVGNGSGATDAWSMTFWFKPGTASNASQTVAYFGSQDIANQGHIQIKYNGSLKRFEMRYGTNNNRLNFTTQSNSLTVGQWHHFIVTYNGGTTGSSSGSLNAYYSRFKFFLDGSDVTNTMIRSHNNFGYTGSVIGQNWRVGRYNTGQSMRNNCKVDELAVFNDDVSALASDIYNSGVPFDLMTLGTQPEHWWRMGDGDSFPYLFDVGFQANCIFVMNSMTPADIVNDTP